jgi:hypothetical protein
MGTVPTERGIGRKVEPGRLDINALVEAGGMTTKAEDGSAILIPADVTHYETAGEMRRARYLFRSGQNVNFWPGRNARGLGQ